MINCFQRSRPKKLIILVLLILVSLSIVSVSAVPSIDISAVGSISNWALTPGTDNPNMAISLTVMTTDTSSWHVYVKDANDDLKSPSWSGRMVEYDGTQYVTENPKVLEANLSVIGAGDSAYTGATATLGPIDQTIETGTAPVAGVVIPLTIKQPTTFLDPHLTTTNHVYRVIVTYTGTPS
jgi:hypothetical protein